MYLSYKALFRLLFTWFSSTWIMISSDLLPFPVSSSLSLSLLIDSNGVLKIADFGLATFFDPRNSVPLTSRVVTLWYRPPELLLGACHYGVGVDLWSAGCILGELYSGKPILPGKTELHITILNPSRNSTSCFLGGATA